MQMSYWQKLYETYAPRIEPAIRSDMDTGFAVFPPRAQWFRAFELCPLEKTRVVIVGQDPYVSEGLANGLCFSVPEGQRPPPSLRAIFKELERCYGVERGNPDLSDWAAQGVLLLNRALTVREGLSNSHRNLWLDYTDAVVRAINDQAPPGVVFMLWGNDARALRQFVDCSKHSLLEWTHPSPLSRRPFVGNDHFVTCNERLALRLERPDPIDWVMIKPPPFKEQMSLL